MKLRVLSDIHIDNWKGVKTPEEIISADKYPADAILMAGDFGNSIDEIQSALSAASDAYPQCFFCLGNHDLCVHWDAKTIGTTERKIDAVRTFSSSHTNLHMLDGTVEPLGSFRIGGCTGWWDPDFDDPLVEFRWKHEWFDGANMNYGNLRSATVKEQGKLRAVLAQHPDIMMTHFAPVTINTNPEYKWSAANKYFYFYPGNYDWSGVKYWICGHTHDAHVSRYKDTVILCNPYGYYSGFDGTEHPYSLNNLSQNDFIIEV